jgi:hypothetical protein
VRVPVPVVILLVLLVAGGVWWKGTRSMDFLTPPSEEKLAAIRTKVEAAIAEPERTGSPAKLPKPPAAPEAVASNEPTTPALDLGDLESPPTLESYSDRAIDGHAKVAELAAALEKEGQFQRSLLAWERSIDSTEVDPSQVAAAITNIRRIRPTLPDWNTDANTAIPVVLHAGTGPALAEALRPILEEAAKELSLSSSGVLKVTSELAVGKRIGSKGPIPVALWLSGPAKDSLSTDVLSFTVDKTEVLADEVYKIAFQLISSHIKRSVKLTPPSDPLSGETPLQALQSNITRLSWREFGKSLNTTEQ